MTGRTLAVAPPAAPLPGPENMALDEAMLELADEGAGRGYFRLYRWARPTLSLGYAQPLSGSTDAGYCAREGIDVVRRVTGGGAVLHDRELTYAVAMPWSFAEDPSLRGCYGIVSAALAEALRGAGVPAERSDPCAWRSDGKHAACFASTAPDEIHVGGRKLVGSAQRRGRRAFLQHGSILLRADGARHLRAVGATAAAGAEGGWIGAEEVTGVPLDEPALRAGLAERLAAITASLATGEWEAVATRASELVARHRSREWIARVP